MGETRHLRTSPDIIIIIIIRTKRMKWMRHVACMEEIYVYKICRTVI